MIKVQIIFLSDFRRGSTASFASIGRYATAFYSKKKLACFVIDHRYCFRNARNSTTIPFPPRGSKSAVVSPAKVSNFFSAQETPLTLKSARHLIDARTKSATAAASALDK
jgi:hypothetical protein